jgi:hypothetical protein
MFQATGAWAADGIKPIGQINEYLRLMGELYGSHETWNFFRPDPAINNNNDYGLWAARARLGALLTTPYIDGYAQAQYIGLYSLPDDAVASPGGPLGLGGVYFLANQSTNASNVFLKQAYLDLKFSSLGLPRALLKIGRFEFMDGMEYTTGIGKFDGLKRARIAQRLLASNVVHVGRSFDGFTAVYDWPGFNVTAAGIRPTQGVPSRGKKKSATSICFMRRSPARRMRCSQEQKAASSTSITMTNAIRRRWTTVLPQNGPGLITRT